MMLTLLTVGCAKTVKIDNEAETKTGKIEEVPKWFVEKTDGKGFMGKKDKFYVYGVGVATSPDLQLATEKATLIAKADIADVMSHAVKHLNYSLMDFSCLCHVWLRDSPVYIARQRLRIIAYAWPATRPSGVTAHAL